MLLLCEKSVPVSSFIYSAFGIADPAVGVSIF